MPSSSGSRPLEQSPAVDTALQEILGYLNFSNGKPDPAFQRNLNCAFTFLGIPGRPAPDSRTVPADADHPVGLLAELRDLLRQRLDEAHRTLPAFVDCAQAEAALRLIFDEAYPAYRRFHADLLFHLGDHEFEQPFFIARIAEAVLEQGPPWDETSRIVDGALAVLNDFVGFRPVALLENERKTEPYAHERFRPIPIYLAGAGVAAGPYHDLITRTLAFFRETPPAILREAHFDLDVMAELAVDVRAHDHTHPVNKRTNYMFGEWDPHQIDLQGRYRRFVVRKIILDALLQWMDDHPEIDSEERLHDAAAVLCGTMLMASAISGSGPDTHDSSVTLTSLLPKVARQRDAFYARLLSEASGPRARRLKREAQLTQQPFGHVRQHLNIDLARYGARQVQYRSLAQLYARMGDTEAARQQAVVIPSTSARFETEIWWRIAAGHRHLDRNEPGEALRRLREIEDHLHRGIECGALVDPWNVLGFQGQFPLFTSREDAVPDQRVETLLEIMEETFELYSRALSTAAVRNEREVLAALVQGFQALASEWDRYATAAVEDLPEVSGQESFNSADQVWRALAEWRAAGEAAGDVSFWREHVVRFESPKAFAQVVDLMLQHRDFVAAMGLLMHWLSQADDVGLESGPHSIHPLLVRWMRLVTDQADLSAEGVWASLRKMFDYLEVNAGELWSVPSLEDATGPLLTDDDFADEDALFDPFEEDEEDDDQGLFDAAYEGVIYRDSAEDGNAGDTLDTGYAPQNTEFESVTRSLEPRLRFLRTLAELWQIAGTAFARRDAAAEFHHDSRDARIQTLTAWYRRTQELQRALIGLLGSVRDYELTVSSGDYDANVEYDIQMQMKLGLLHSIIGTIISFRAAERCLLCALPVDALTADISSEKRQLAEIYRAVVRSDTFEIRRLLPKLLEHLARRPLLYVSLESGGEPRQVLAARSLQAVLRFLLSHLPKLGLFRETWLVLRTAYRMERTARPDGQAVTEFDRLFRIALHGTIQGVIRSSETWRSRGRRTPGPSVQRVARPSAAAVRVSRPALRGPARRLPRRGRNVPSAGRLPRSHRGRRRLGLRTAPHTHPRDALLVRAVGEFVERYLELWLRHSSTMRLSTVEALRQESIWNDIRVFIQEYGADLFHARMLIIGNIRTILHNGVDEFLDQLEEQQDPLKPIKLIEDLTTGRIDREQAEGYLEWIYGSIVDKFDRFLEYNTTTTQSDYGEMFYSLLDFLRLEARYERDAWNLTPLALAHELLARYGRGDAARAWEAAFRARTVQASRRYLAELKSLEQAHGMRLPSITDRLNEQFIKPLAVNRMLALIPRAMAEARSGRNPSAAFAKLRREIDGYLASTSGSGIETPVWLRALEREVDHLEARFDPTADTIELEVDLPQTALSLRRIERQLQSWDQPVRKRGRR